jgi:hypothetical protein
MTPKKLMDSQLVLLHVASLCALLSRGRRIFARGNPFDINCDADDDFTEPAPATAIDAASPASVPAGGSLPVWRRDDDQGAFALRITAARPVATRFRMR